MRFAVGLVPLLVGCVNFEDPFDVTLSADGVTLVDAEIERGDFVYQGIETDEFSVEGISRGGGSSANGAKKREAGNAYSAEVDGDTLQIRARSEYNNASVDFDVLGPEVMDVVVEASAGTVLLETVDGYHVVGADSFVGEGLIGSLDLLAATSADVEIYPYVDGVIEIEVTSGPATLALPVGGGYDIEVWGNPEYPISIAELGFYDTYFGEGYFSGQSGDGGVRVVVRVENGEFTLLEAF